MALEVGKVAPKFEANMNGGGSFSLKDCKGKWVVLYFYPKDDTDSCTKEACGFNENIDEITKLGAIVVGVSPDSPSSHDKFIAKYNLSFQLVSDEDKEICKKYESWGEKSMYGRNYMGVIRNTYLINPKGKIARIFYKVTPSKHIKEVIKSLKELA